jgi:hypothetical protein
MQMSDQQIQALPPDQQQQVIALKSQLTAAAARMQ